MNTVFKKVIMLFVMMGIFLLPISPSIGIKEIEAQTIPTLISIKTNANNTSVKVEVVIKNTKNNPRGIVKLYDKEPNDPSSAPATPNIDSYTLSDIEPNKDLQVFVIDKFDSLSPKTPYWIRVTVTDDKEATYQMHTFLTNSTSSDPTATTQTNTETTYTNARTPITGNYDLGCSIFSGDGIIGCVALIFYVVWEVSALVAQLAGQFLDFLIYYSTNSTSYKSEFVSKGWEAVRDIANIFFIIALLYIAIKMILSLDDHHGKKMITTIIMVALIINFSLFITQVVIDGSNILAKVFYNNIDSKYENKKPANGAKGEKSISVGLIDKYNPKNIIDSDAYKSGRGSFIFVTLLLIAITLYSAYIFFTVGMLFISRVVMLWFSMIFAPIAFASYTLPFEIPGLGHREWWKQLFENAFLAPIFIFMLYLVVMFAGFLKNIFSYPADSGWMMIVMSRVIPFLILTVLLMKAKEMAVKYAGEMGGMFQKIGSFVGGAAVGVAAGAGGFALRATAGRAGSAIANSGWANKMANSEKSGALGWASRRFGTGIKNVGNAAGKGSFDVRGAKIAGQSLGSTGLKVNVLGGPNVGGFEKQRKTRIENRQRKANKLEVGDYEPEMKALKQMEANLKVAEMKTHADIEGIDKKLTAKRQILDDAKKTGAPQETIDSLGNEIKILESQKTNIKNGFKSDDNGNKIKIGTKKVLVEVDEVIEKETDEDEMEDRIIDTGGIKQTVQVKTGNKKKILIKTGKKIEKEEEVDDFEKEEKYLVNGESLISIENSVKHQKHHIAEENIRRREVVASEYATRGSKTWNKIITLGQYDEAERQETINQIRSGTKAPAKEKKSHDSHGGGHGGDSHGGGHAPKHEEKHDDHKGHDSHGGGHAPKH